MFASVKPVAVSYSPGQLNYEHEKQDAQGAAKAIDLPLAQKVVIDVSAILSISKYARDCTSGYSVVGALCGLQIGSTVEVTLSFPFPMQLRYLNDVGPREKEFGERLQRELTERKVLTDMLATEGFDTNHVGLYLGASLCSKALVEMDHTLKYLYERQSKSNPAVLLVYDPLTAAEFGKLNLTAFTLTKEYYECMHELSGKRNLGQDEQQEFFVSHGVHQSGILREIPVEIRCSSLHKMMLHQVDTLPVATSSAMANSVVVEQYLEELLNKTAMNCDQMKRATLGTDRRLQLLLTEQLKRQTNQLLGLCDTILLHSGIVDETF